MDRDGTQPPRRILYLVRLSLTGPPPLPFFVSYLRASLSAISKGGAPGVCGGVGVGVGGVVGVGVVVVVVEVAVVWGWCGCACVSVSFSSSRQHVSGYYYPWAFRRRCHLLK